MNNKIPKVSVIMNCFNSDKYLFEAIESVRAQTFSDWEIVFWDNQSTDQSAKIVQSFCDPRIRYIYAPTHTTLGEARALAIQEAHGTWVALLDCDDWWTPQKLEAQMVLAEINSALGLIYSDMWVCDAELKPVELGSARFTMRRGHVWRDLLTSRNFIPCPAALMRRDAVLEVGNFDPRLKFCEEYDLFLRIAARYPVDYVAEPLVKYRLHGGNTTGRGTRATTVEVIRTVRENFRASEDRSWATRLRVGARLGVLYGRSLVQAG